jgi:hypothetical protein
MSFYACISRNNFKLFHFSVWLPDCMVHMKIISLNICIPNHNFGNFKTETSVEKL